MQHLGQDEQQLEVIRFLSRPDSYGRDVRQVDQVETHISHLFLVGDFVYKLKRALAFPYLNFSTLKRRRQFCKIEVRINRRTAPKMYLGVVPVTRKANGDLVLGGDGPAVEWLVKMARFDEQTLFSRLASRGALDDALLEQLAETIAGFHKSSSPVRKNREPERALRILELNQTSFLSDGGRFVSADQARQLTKKAVQFLEGVSGLLVRREAAGRVRHCHGDLHLRNICLFEGRPTLFDAIEFNVEFSRIDVFYDLAFLLMDLEYWGLRDKANIVLNRYLDLTGDVEGLGLLPLFLSMRAAVRSHVHLAQFQNADIKDESIGRVAGTYFQMSEDYLAPPTPRLLAVGGLSGSGKSSLARGLAGAIGAAPGARVVRTDAIRKRLCGVGLYDRLPPESYTKEMSRKTYAAVFTEVRVALDSGHSVIADAVFSDVEERRQIEQIAKELNVPFLGFWLDVPEATLIDRVNRRTGDISDATQDVVRTQLTYETGPMEWVQIDASGTFSESLAHAKVGLQAWAIDFN